MIFYSRATVWCSAPRCPSVVRLLLSWEDSRHLRLGRPGTPPDLAASLCMVGWREHDCPGWTCAICELASKTRRLSAPLPVPISQTAAAVAITFAPERHDPVEKALETMWLLDAVAGYETDEGDLPWVARRMLDLVA